MERGPHPTPEEIIQAVGCGRSADIDRCLLDVADAEFDKEEGDGPQDIERAFNCLRAILMRHWENPAPEVQKYVAAALMRRAQVLAHYKCYDEARNDFAEVRRRYEDSRDINVRRSVAAAFHEAGNMEERLGNPDEAADWYEAAIENFGSDRDDMVDIQLADMRIDLALIYIGRGWRDLAHELLDSGILRWENHREYWLRRKAANMRMHRAYSAGSCAKTREDQEAALLLFDQAIEYADQALNQRFHFTQGICFAEKARLLYSLDRYAEVVDCTELFRQRVTDELDENPGCRTELAERFKELLKQADLLAAHSRNLLGQPIEALLACDRTGVVCGDDDYTSVDDKQFAINVLAARIIAHSRLHSFSIAMRYLVEIYKVAGCNVDESWTSAMVVSVGRAIEALDTEVRKAGVTLDEITIQVGDLPDPS